MDLNAYNTAIGILYTPCLTRQDREQALRECAAKLSQQFGLALPSANRIALCAWADLDSAKLFGLFVDLSASTSNLVVIRHSGGADMVFTLADLVQHYQGAQIARMLSKRFSRTADSNDSQLTVQ